MKGTEPHIYTPNGEKLRFNHSKLGIQEIRNQTPLHGSLIVRFRSENTAMCVNHIASENCKCKVLGWFERERERVPENANPWMGSSNHNTWIWIWVRWLFFLFHALSAALNLQLHLYVKAISSWGVIREENQRILTRSKTPKSGPMQYWVSKVIWQKRLGKCLVYI